MMKILFVQNSFGERSEAFLYRMCCATGYFNVNVLTGKRINKEETPYNENDIKVWTKPVSIFNKLIPYINRRYKLPGSYSEYTSGIIREINNSDADLVCFQLSTVAISLGNHINSINKKICIIHHGTDINKAFENKDLQKRLPVAWKAADKIIFASKHLMEQAFKLGCPQRKSTVNYLGVPISTKTQKHDHISGTPFRFICVARLTHVKNHINLIRAFAQIVYEKKHSVELVLIGNGELINEIKDEITSLKVNDYIKVLGSLNSGDVINQISRSDCIILVSKIHIIDGIIRQEEGLGISLLEGGSLGLPMIGSNSGGIPEIITHNINGYLVNQDSVTDIKTAMIKILQNPDKTREMGAAAKSSITKEFNFDIQIEKFMSIFSEVISQDS